MDVSKAKFHGARAFVALIALTIGAGAMQASNLLTAAVGAGLTCSTTAGPGASTTILIKPVTTPVVGTIVVTYANLAGFTITPPATTSLTSANQSAGLTYTIVANAGCAGVSGSVAFSTGAGIDVSAAIVDTVTATATALVAPATLAISCTLNGGTYTPAAAQTVSVTSAATGGTPFTVDTTVANDPAWVTLNPTSPSGTATAAASAFTVAATPTGGSPGCGGFLVNTTHTFNLHLKSGVSGTTPDAKVLVTLSIVPLSPLILTPVAPATSLSLSYVKSTGSAGTVNVSVSSPSVPSAYFTVNTSSFPNWLTVDYQTGNTVKALRFSTTNVADSLPPGTYSASISMSVSSYADLSVPITLLVTNKPATLSVSPASITIPWILGANAPTATLTATSSDSPIAFSIVTGGTLLPIVNPAGPAQEVNLSTNQLTGLAYSFGTNIPISFNPSLFTSVTPGQQLTGTVTFTWGSPAAVIVVPVTINVQSPGATLTSISPATIPTAAAGSSVVISLYGTGFVGGSDPTTKTRIGTVAGAAPGVISPDTNFSLTWINSNYMTLTITVPNTADTLLPFSPTGISGVFGGPIYLGIVNGTGSSVPTGTKTLTIGNGPLIQGVTSASAFTEVSGTTLPTIAPYDMISIFGANFCASGGTGCGTATILQNAPDAITSRYPATLSPDAVSATQRVLSVNFMAHGTTTPLWPAPLLFATNGQINAVVPAAVAAAVGTVANNLGVDIVVSFGYSSAAPATLLKSNTFSVNIAASDPGIFTIGSDGQGPAAALNANWALIGPTNPAGMRTGVANGPDSDTIQLYVTGLGAPTSNGDNTSAGDGTGALTNCIGAVTASGTGSYQATLGGGYTNIDGDVIQASLLNTSRFAPCLTTVPTVTIGGQPGTVTYAGFVANTIAGLYQINVQLPPTYTNGQPLHPDFPTNSVAAQITTLKTATQLPVFVTVGAGTPSQAGAMLSVIPRLFMTAPSNLTTLQVGHFWTGTVLAQEGTGNNTFAVTSGVLPNGLTLAATTGVISGTPGPNTNGSVTVTVTATDSASVPLTGSVTFTITVAGGLYVTSTGVAPYNAVYGTPSASLTSIKAIGGVFPYTYVITTPASNPTGMLITTSTVGQNSIGVLSTSNLTPAGTYVITVTATDAANVTGTLQFTVVVALNLTFNPTSAVAVTAADTTTTITTVTAAGGSGNYHYTLDGTLNSANALLLLLDPNTGILTNNGAIDSAGMTVYIDATDTAPVNGAAAGTSTIVVVIAN